MNQSSARILTLHTNYKAQLYPVKPELSFSMGEGHR